MKTIFVSAGEASGDLHAAALISALKARDRGLRFFGLGGELMRSEGAELIYDLRALAVTGFWEVAKRFHHFRKVYLEAIRSVEREKLALAILVDYPGMNLRLAGELQRRGCPVVYYIVPQVWAWKPGRIKEIEDRVDLLLSILPFEKALFDPAKIKCEFVGHPLLDVVSPDLDPLRFRHKYGISPDRRIIGLLPGSRLVEITRHYRTMLETVKRLESEGHHVTAVTAVRDEIGLSLYTKMEQAIGIQPVHVADDRYELLKSADVSVVASGTATLEAALCGRPFCVVYKTGWITYQLARRLIKLNVVGLVNIVAGEKIVPEFLQTDMHVNNLAGFCRKMFVDLDARETMIRKLQQVRNKLGQPGASERAAELIHREFLQ